MTPHTQRGSRILHTVELCTERRSPYNSAVRWGRIFTYSALRLVKVCITAAQSIPEWAVAVAEEVKSVLLPATPGFARLDPDRLDPATEARRTEIVQMQLFVTTIHMGEFLDHDLDQEERLDSRIAKLIRELIEIKSNKQALRRTDKDK